MVTTRLIRWIPAVLAGLGLLLAGNGDRAIAQLSDAAAMEEATPFLRPPTMCPTDVEVLSAGLLRDLPSYANRVASRSLGLSEDDMGFGTVLMAGQAEFEPLDISTLTFDSDPTATTEDPQQVFFTTLERHYTPRDVVYLEQYHWLFLTEAEDGWHLGLIFSRTAADEATIRPPTAPRENSDGIIGQAVRLWLRDCRAGAIYPIEIGEDGDRGR